MEIDFYIQSQAFLYSLLFGVGLGMLYGVFKFIRVALLSTKTAVIIADIIFMLIASIALFLYSLAMLYGYVRIYIVFGALCGFLAYRFSLGKLISRIYCPIINAINVIIQKIKTKFKKITKIRDIFLIIPIFRIYSASNQQGYIRKQPSVFLYSFMLHCR